METAGKACLFDILRNEAEEGIVTGYGVLFVSNISCNLKALMRK